MNTIPSMTTQEHAVKITATYVQQPGDTSDAHVEVEVVLTNDSEAYVLVVDVEPVAPLGHAYSGVRTLSEPVALAPGESHKENVPVWLTTGPTAAPSAPQFAVVEIGDDVDLDELRALGDAR